MQKTVTGSCFWFRDPLYFLSALVANIEHILIQAFCSG